MNGCYDYTNTVLRAAALAKGNGLDALQRICEQQKTISTRRLELYLNELREDMKLDAIHFRALADHIAKLEESEC